MGGNSNDNVGAPDWVARAAALDGEEIQHTDRALELCSHGMPRCVLLAAEPSKYILSRIQLKTLLLAEIYLGPWAPHQSALDLSHYLTAARLVARVGLG